MAGKRAGLAGGRSGLFYEATRICDELKATWAVFENVPGLYSSEDGRDFASVLMELERGGYNGAWRVFDAQYFGLAQLRRRVFGVFARGDSGAESCAEILSIREGLRGHPAPSRKAREGIAGTLESRTRGGGFPGTDGACAGHIQVETVGTITPGAHPGSYNGQDAYTGHLIPTAFNHQSGGSAMQLSPLEDKANTLQVCQTQAVAFKPSHFTRDKDGAPSEIMPPLSSDADKGDQEPVVLTLAVRGRGDGRNLEVREDGTANAVLTPNGGRDGMGCGAVAFAQNTRDEVRELGGNIAGALSAQPGMKQQTYLNHGSCVRRLTPTECERLQGFPDGHTAGFSDSTRYRMLGNAVAVPVAEWIARRLVRVAGA